MINLFHLLAKFYSLSISLLSDSIGQFNLEAREFGYAFFWCFAQEFDRNWELFNKKVMRTLLLDTVIVKISTCIQPIVIYYYFPENGYVVSSISASLAGIIPSRFCRSCSLSKNGSNIYTSAVVIIGELASLYARKPL